MAFLIGNEFLQNSVASSLINEITSKSDRGLFLGRFRTVKMIPAFGFTLFGILYIGDEMTREEHRIMLIAALLLSVFSLNFMRKIPATPPPKAVSDSVGRGRFLKIVTTSPLLKLPLLLEGIKKVLNWPIFGLFLIGYLNLPANIFFLYLLSQMSGPFLSVFFWGKRADITGFKSIYLTVFLATIALTPLIFLIPDFDAIPYMGPQWIVGVSALIIFGFLQNTLKSGHGIASSMYHTQFLNKADSFHAVNILTMFGAFMQSAITALGGYFLIITTNNNVNIISNEGFIWIDSFRIFSIGIIIIACLLGIFLSRRIN
ncbi:hypothetical protein ACWU4D_18025 [Vibrio sp. WJH972]